MDSLCHCIYMPNVNAIKGIQYLVKTIKFGFLLHPHAHPFDSIFMFAIGLICQVIYTIHDVMFIKKHVAMELPTCLHDVLHPSHVFKFSCIHFLVSAKIWATNFDKDTNLYKPCTTILCLHDHVLNGKLWLYKAPSEVV